MAERHTIETYGRAPHNRNIWSTATERHTIETYGRHAWPILLSVLVADSFVCPSGCTLYTTVPPLWNKLTPALRQISESSYELTQTSPLKISPRLFHSKLKTLFFGKLYSELSSSSYLPPRLNFKHHSP